MITLKTEPHQEHVQPDAELGADEQHRPRLGRKQRGLKFGRHQAEQRRPQDDPGDHLSHDLRLVEPRLGRPADHAASGDDHRHLQEKSDAEFGVRHAPACDALAFFGTLTLSTRLAEAIGEDKPPRRSNEGDAVHPPG